MEHFDVVVVGGGLSGIGAAYHLQDKCPDRTFVILEGRDSIGGTWDLFRYPGIRSDSDMHTLGFEFKPWRAEKSIADGPAILNYLNETCDEYGIRNHIRLGHRVVGASWNTTRATWELDVVRSGGEHEKISCNYLYMCAGYYSYEGGYVPDFAGIETFHGTIVHPQKWPEDLDYEGKKVVVIGSGATAITVVPAMATTASHVTMLQRTPTYVVARPDTDKFANFMRKVLPPRAAYAVTRKKNTVMQQFIYGKTRTAPNVVKKKILDAVREELGPDYDVEKHFTPPYNPWDQRLCLVTNGDLFKGIREGRIEVVTDTIKEFNENGIVLDSGKHLAADIIVMATGLQLLVAPGNLKFTIDGKELDFSKTWTYKGFAYSGVPNMGS
ncbi:MAG: NAD(P)/FAD-dependent oxidoreductase, partial [Actinobacteria bacterium]|nr:NAD(P)/FAD-dependent oxidoreductase [Actinomycetota bacterium]